MKTRPVFLVLLLSFMFVSFQTAQAEAEPGLSGANNRRGEYADAYSLINEVNLLRAANGLPAYAISPILMSIAQQHAEFMSVNGVSHIGYGGTHPYQRALNAGYNLAGDLSLGGFFSENITAGVDKSVQDAVQEWQGDAPHLNTMLSPNLSEIGAGVALVGKYAYYVIDCAQPSGGSAAKTAATPVLGADQTATTPPVSTIVPATPDADGKIYHLVQPGETLWLIAISYGIKVADLRKLNNLAENANIYPKMRLLVKIVPLPTATTTKTPTELPTYTPVPTWTALPTETFTPLPTEKVATATSPDGLPVLAAIVVAALVLAGVLAASMRVRK